MDIKFIENYKLLLILVIAILFFLYIHFKNKNLRIDIVFTYVDGNDPNFIRKKIKYSKENNIKFNPSIRYENINEIYFSVNSVIKFIPWINKIYIVTDEQIPPIDENLIKSGKVEIVYHKKIIPEKYLPTFNSDTIESFLHNIPNLSEIFLYNNDDVMHLDYVYPDDIYEQYGKKISLKIRSHNMEFKLKAESNSEFRQRLKLTSNILKNIYPSIILVYNHHTKILRKSTMKYVEKKYDYLLNPMRSSRFRNDNYIQYIFFILSIDNLLNNNLITYSRKDFIEIHNKVGETQDRSDKFDNLWNQKYKFVCLNNMNIQQKDNFYKLMSYKLSNRS